MLNLSAPLNIRRFIAEAAVSRADQLSIGQRADLFDAVAEILDGEESEQARVAAWSLRESERHQLTLGNLLRSEK